MANLRTAHPSIVWSLLKRYEDLDHKIRPLQKYATKKGYALQKIMNDLFHLLFDHEALTSGANVEPRRGLEKFLRSKQINIHQCEFCANDAIDTAMKDIRCPALQRRYNHAEFEVDTDAKITDADTLSKVWQTKMDKLHCLMCHSVEQTYRRNQRRRIRRHSKEFAAIDIQKNKKMKD